MRIGFTALFANNDADGALSASPVAAVVLMKWRRVILLMFGDYERRFIVSINEHYDAT
jgi:hypothetical protein